MAQYRYICDTCGAANTTQAGPLYDPPKKLPCWVRECEGELILHHPAKIKDNDATEETASAYWRRQQVLWASYDC